MTNLSIVAIDPGDRHCGVAFFGNNQVQFVDDNSPSTLYKMLESRNFTRNNTVIVVEEFRLYPWKMKEQGMNEMKTPGVIAVIDYICFKRGLQVVKQGANIKEPTRALMKTMGLENPGRNLHMRDAVEHGYHYLFKNTDLLDDLRALIRKGNTHG